MKIKAMNADKRSRLTAAAAILLLGVSASVLAQSQPLGNPPVIIAPTSSLQVAATSAQHWLAADEAPAASLPKPDFSEMEKWFEIVRYEYPDPPEREMFIYIKPKVDKRPDVFYMEWRDKDGVLVQEQSVSWIVGSYELDDTKTGTVGKVHTQVPSELQMPNVVSAKVMRVKH